MKSQLSPIAGSNLTRYAAQKSLATAFLTIVLLGVLHLVSPEFDPSWRMVSEYANGGYGWILALLFLSWATSTWTLAYSLYPQLSSRIGKIGLGFLVASGFGELLAAGFDINHSLHSLAAFIGIGSFPIATLLVGNALSKKKEWESHKRTLVLISHTPWIALVLMIGSFVLLMWSFAQSGGDLSGAPVSVLPAGVIAVVGYANRALILVYCTWLAVVSWLLLSLQKNRK